MLDEIKRINEEQRVRFIRKVRGALRTIKGKRLAVLGLAFKDGTDDVRESPAIKVIEQFLEEKCQIIAFDPAAMDRAGRFWTAGSAMPPILTPPLTVRMPC